ncbi:MAG: hypothetical protein V1754_08840, partial [Pseudomonadota bacterium]
NALEKRAAQNEKREDGDDDLSMLETYETMQRIAEEKGPSLHCLVCVTFGTGGIPQIKIVRGSGRSPFDKLATQTILKAARILDAPLELVGSQACYEMSSIFTRVPILPFVGCTFDESKPSINCFYPTMKLQKSKVELISALPAS